MKKLFLIIFLIYSNYAWALSQKQLLSQFEEAIFKNQFSYIIDLYDEYEENLANNIKAQFYYAKALEGQNQNQESISVYEKILKKYYRKLTRSISKKAFRGKKYKHQVPGNLKLIYFKLAQLYTKKYTETHEETEEKTKKKYLKKSLAFIRLSRSISKESEHIDEQQERLLTKRMHFQGLKYQSHFYIFTGIIAWQDNVIVQDTQNGRIPLLNTSRGNCIGIGRSWQNSKKEYFFDGCYISAKSTVDSELSTFTYNQSKVPVTGFFGGPGISWKTFTDNLSIGTQVVILSRTGSWDSNNSNQRIEQSKLNAIGLSFHTKWNFWKLSFIGRFARLLKTKSSTISISSAINF